METVTIRTVNILNFFKVHDFIKKNEPEIYSNIPWGDVDLGTVRIANGWYILATSGENAICLTLKQYDRFELIELVAAPHSPAYIHLSSGVYSLHLSGGARPNVRTIKTLNLSPLSLPSRFHLLFDRAFAALQHGRSLKDITRLAFHVLTQKGTYGIRSARQQQKSEPPQGALLIPAVQQRAMQMPKDVSARLISLQHKPVILIRYRDGSIHSESLGALGLTTQVYPHWTTDPLKFHDAVLICDEAETLTPDALLLLAETISADPEKQIIICDRYEGGLATARVAFDPLLYTDGYPTPYLLFRSDSFPADLTWHEAEPRHGLLSTPIAITTTVSLPTPQTFTPKVVSDYSSIIIPTRDAAPVLRQCLDRLLENTVAPHEIIVVDNGSVQDETFKLFEEYASKGIRTVRDDGDFNFSRLCNLGASVATGRFLVFMNNDIMLLNAHWLEAMTSLAALPEAGAVGARLLYEDRSLQHGGVVLGMTQICGHLWRGLPYEDQAKEPRLIRNSLRAAVTAALMCVEKSKFDGINGFDEQLFPVTLNDVDFCLRLRAKGYYNIYCAEACAYHPEGVTRGTDTRSGKFRRRQKELAAFAERWGHFPPDPWFPPAFMRSTERLGLKKPL